MMSANLRRLVLDPFPLWQTGLAILFWLILFFEVVVWAHGTYAGGLIMVLMIANMMIGFVAKVRIWEMLPVSRTALRQAQWWYLWGRPWIFVLTAMAAAIAVDASLGWLRVSLTDATAYLGGQFTLLGFLSLGMCLTSWLAPRFGAWGAFAGGSPLLVGLGVGFHWVFADTLATFYPEMTWGGVLSIALGLFIYALSPWVPLIRPKPLAGGARTRREPASVRARAAGRTAGTGTVFVLLLRRLMRTVPLVIIAGATVAWLTTRVAILADFVFFDAILLFAPLIGAVGAITTTVIVSQRVLAGLPLSVTARTVALQAVSPAFQALLVALVVAAEALTCQGAPSGDWLVDLGLAVSAALALSALALPASLRFGRKAPVLLVACVAVPVSATSGVIISMQAHHAGLFGIMPAQVIPGLVCVLLMLLTTGWAWTWLELAHGRAAYRQWAWMPVNWRGQ